jgi:uncharacterized protein (DUF433 family)
LKSELVTGHGFHRAGESLEGRVAPGLKSAYAFSVNSSDLITVDSGILGGTPVFRGTRVPVQTLFQYLESNYTLDEFLECFPTVTREAAIALLDRSEVALLSMTR